MGRNGKGFVRVTSKNAISRVLQLNRNIGDTYCLLTPLKLSKLNILKVVIKVGLNTWK